MIPDTLKETEYFADANKIILTWCAGHCLDYTPFYFRLLLTTPLATVAYYCAL